MTPGTLINLSEPEGEQGGGALRAHNQKPLVFLLISSFPLSGKRGRVTKAILIRAEHSKSSEIIGFPNRTGPG